MCKHIAAVLYGIGARLDEKPELLFSLRNVDQQDLIANASQRMTKVTSTKLLEIGDLCELFGIDISEAKAKGRKTNKRRSRPLKK